MGCGFLGESVPSLAEWCLNLFYIKDKQRAEKNAFKKYWKFTILL